MNTFQTFNPEELDPAAADEQIAAQGMALQSVLEAISEPAIANMTEQHMALQRVIQGIKGGAGRRVANQRKQLSEVVNAALTPAVNQVGENGLLLNTIQQSIGGTQEKISGSGTQVGQYLNLTPSQYSQYCDPASPLWNPALCPPDIATHEPIPSTPPFTIPQQPLPPEPVYGPPPTQPPPTNGEPCPPTTVSCPEPHIDVHVDAPECPKPPPPAPINVIVNVPGIPPITVQPPPPPPPIGQPPPPPPPPGVCPPGWECYDPQSIPACGEIPPGAWQRAAIQFTLPHRWKSVDGKISLYGECGQEQIEDALSKYAPIDKYLAAIQSGDSKAFLFPDDVDLPDMVGVEDRI